MSRPIIENAFSIHESMPELIEKIGDAQIVLLGEASHGTHEFYAIRAQISKELIEKKGFTAIAIEGDWPDAYKVHRFIQQEDISQTAISALAEFKRFPSWMWRNKDVVELVAWLKSYNSAIKNTRPLVGFYGIDLYSLHRSMQAVISYLDGQDPDAAEWARRRYACFDKFGADPQAYGYLVGHHFAQSCQKEVLAQLQEFQKHTFEAVHADGFVAQDELFYAEQNALIVKNAEHYYRSVFEANDSGSWNIRDTHMMETVQALVGHLEKQNTPAKIILWAHNSHVGDARATEMARDGQLNVGQLIRQKYHTDAAIVGFTTYHGTVSAASSWGGQVERKQVRPALKDSCEALFHATGLDEFWLDLKMHGESLREPRLQRAIGVIYQPRTERQSHYFYTSLPDQFDIVIHIDRTQAVEPLEKTSEWEEGEFPETYPSGE